MTFHDDELDDFLSEKLKLVEPTPARDPESARLRRDAYIRTVQQMQPGRAVFTPAGLLQRKPWQDLFNLRSPQLRFAVAILLIFGLVLGSWGTVSAAQNSLPNDYLYAVKLTGENLQLTLTSNTETRVDLLATYTDRRVDEAITLALQGEPIPEKLPDRMEEHLDELFMLIASMDETSAQEALRGVQIHLRDQDQNMTNAMNGLPESRDPQLVQLQAMLRNRQQIAQRRLEQTKESQFQNKFKHQPGNQERSITGTVTTTLTTTSELTPTVTAIPGHYGPGACEIPGACTPAGETYGPGPFEGTSPATKDQEGYGPGPDQGPGPSQPSSTPNPAKNQAPQGTQSPYDDDSSGDPKRKNGSDAFNKP